MRTHLDVQQREDVRRDLAGRMKFVPPDLRAGENVFYLQEDPSKIQQGRKCGKWLKVEIVAIKGPMAVVCTGSTIFQAKYKKIMKTFRYCGSGRTSRLARANRSTCSKAPSRRTSRCLGNVFRQFLFERHS